jgi:hypothetical protein
VDQNVDLYSQTKEVCVSLEILAFVRLASDSLHFHLSPSHSLLPSYLPDSPSLSLSVPLSLSLAPTLSFFISLTLT